MSLRVCTEPGCPTLVKTGRCETHRREREQQRGSSTARGYGYSHRLERLTWKPKVEAGNVDCRRCGARIKPSDAWDLGHPDAVSTMPTAPEHASQCNRRTARHAKAARDASLGSKGRGAKRT